MWRIDITPLHLLHLFCGFHLTEFSVFIHKAFLLSFKVLQ